MIVYLLRNRMVIEFTNVLLNEPLLPCSQLYIVELSEIVKVQLMDDKVIITLCDGASLELDVNNPYRLIKDLTRLIKSRQNL